MKRETGLKLVGAAASASLLFGTLGSAYAAPSTNARPEPGGDSPAGQEAETNDTAAPVVREGIVEGLFAATQNRTSTAAEIAEVFKNASAVLCNGVSHEELSDKKVPSGAMSWEISVSGEVQNEFTASMKELAETNSQTSIMGCTCAGNPADGRATVNAEVTGASLRSIILKAVPTKDANTITFVSSDDYRTSMPLWYVFSHSTVLAYEIDGQPLSESMGATIQLWIDSTAANYFARDVVSIEVTAEDEAPEAPGVQDEYANRPNITVLSGR